MVEISRRVLLGGMVASAGAIAAPGILRAQQLAGNPFTLGVASGDPGPDGFVIWTRLALAPLEEHGGMPMVPHEVAWEVSSDERFGNVVAKGSALARPELGHSVHVEVAGLAPGRPYWYRFGIGREQSAAGRAQSLPVVGSPLAHLRFGVAGCQNYEDGLYTAYGHLAREGDLAFVFHYGDYIYEKGGKPVQPAGAGHGAGRVRTHLGQQIYSLDDYRRRYAQYKLDPDLQAAHAAAPWFVAFDDHEVQNNWTGGEDQDHIPAEIFALRKQAAFQAYYEHMPLRRTSFPHGTSIQIYRRAIYGDLIDLHLLDTRQFRTDQPCDDGWQKLCAGVSDPSAQVLGTQEEAWLYAALREKRARWNALAQQVMMMPLDRREPGAAETVRNMDSWGGYDGPRERLLANLKGLGNAVVLTGDEHQNFAGELRTDGGQGDAVAVEFVSTSIASGGDGSDKSRDADRFLAQNPYLKLMNNRRGYLLCDVTPDRWESRMRTVERVSVPDMPVKTMATITVEHGTPALAIA